MRSELTKSKFEIQLVGGGRMNENAIHGAPKKD